MDEEKRVSGWRGERDMRMEELREGEIKRNGKGREPHERGGMGDAAKRKCQEEEEDMRMEKLRGKGKRECG